MSESAHDRSTEQVMGLLEKVELFAELPPGDLQRIAGIITGTTPPPALEAPGARSAGVETVDESGAGVDPYEVSRMMQAGLLPRTAPRIDGFDVAGGTTTEENGRGGSAWDWIEIGGRTALITVDVRQDGFPPAYQVGVARAVLRAVAKTEASLPVLLARVNDALAEAAVEGLDQFVDMGLLVAAEDGLEWASAGRVPGGVIRRDGTFDELQAHGPPLGMLTGFKYEMQQLSMGPGDTVFVLSHASQGLLLGAADLLAQLHGKPAGEVVATMHRAIRKARGDDRAETSVLYARKH